MLQNYLNLARELKKQQLWNGKMIEITIVIDRLPKGLVRELKELEIGRRTETIRTTDQP